MTGNDLEIGGGLVIPAAEIQESASRSSGPGGQHVNKSATRVTLRWNVVQTGVIGEVQRARLIAKLGPRLTRAGDLIVHADGARSRARNRDAASDRLAELVADALRIPLARRATRPSRSARERRVRDKQKRARVKRQRQRVLEERE